MIPFSKPSLGEEEYQAVKEVFDSGWLTVGDKVKEFEKALEDYTGASYAVAVDSCTLALTLSLKALSIITKIEHPTILIPALTFVATANAAYHAGCDIKFCDIGMDGNIDFYSSKEELYDVYMPVHFAGQVCNMHAVAHETSHTIEDSAHAIGAKYDGVSVGLSEYSSGACFSFYPTKNMTTIEGGAFITNNKELADLVRRLSLHGLDSSHIDRYKMSSLAKPTVEVPGYKANMTNVEAAIGIVQLRKLDSFIAKRKRIAKIYIEELWNIVRFLDVGVGVDHVWHMCVGLVENRDEVVTKLKEQGIGVGIHYNPIIPAHPFYTSLTGYKVGQFPIAEYISERCISLPLYPDMTDLQVEKVIEKVKKVL